MKRYIDGQVIEARQDRIGLYAGSFDPLTNGHLGIIINATDLFDKLYIGVGTNPDKKHMFDSETRANIIRETVEEWDDPTECKIEVVTYDNQFLSSIAQDLKVTHIVRGLRSAKDFEEEQALRDVLRRYFWMHIRFVYVIAEQADTTISSTMVKNCLNFDYWDNAVNQMVPEASFKALKTKAKPEVKVNDNEEDA